MADPNPYDAIPYASYPHHPSHPDQLATVAYLHGLEPPAPSRARVLELGCGVGANPIGIAYGLPDSRVVGVDYAGSAIAAGQELAGAIQLTNLELRVGDVRELADGRLGEFDYVIAHGLYTWVDPETRDALMRTCAAHLAPDGIAYISFNTQPGGHFRRALRELAQWHTAGSADAVEAAERARALFAGLSRLRGSSDPYGALLAAELPNLGAAPIDHLAHDLLAEDWGPAWFSDFAGHAAHHGLQYVGEASFHRFAGPWEPEAEASLWELAGGDPIGYHQLMDFMVWRRFRDSLLCHAGREVAHHLMPARLLDLRLRPAGPLDPSENEPVLAALATHAPHPVRFDALAGQLGADAHGLAAALLGLAQRSRVTVHFEPPVLGTAQPERPTVSRLARRQAATGSPFCTTRLGGIVKLDGDVIRSLLGLADGTRDRAQIRADLHSGGGPQLAPAQLDQALKDLAAMGLLEA
jgi:SAM-dependent methyltransferase